jgi:mannose-1-phosphate guanylyltransferase
MRGTCSSIKAMVLAAGKGTRLLPLTDEVPKPMAPVGGKPIISHIFDLLARSGFEAIYVNVCHLADVILEHFGEERVVEETRVTFSRETELMGTAGGVKRLAGHFDDTFVVIMGDALTDINLRHLVAFHRESEAIATLALRRVTDTTRYGVVELDPENRIVGFQEKPNLKDAISTLANTGIYVLEPRVLEYIPEETFFDFAQDVFPRLLAAGEMLLGYEGEFYWSDVGTLDAYRAAQRDALSGAVSLDIPGETRREGLWVDRGAWLHPSAKVEGPVVIGADAIVGEGVTLAGEVTIGSGCRVRPGATIERSVVLHGSTVGGGCYLEDCIVGPGFYLSPGEAIRGQTLVRTRRTVDLRGANPLRQKTEVSVANGLLSSQG